MRKQVLVVRRDLKMKSGKIAAQCCHAAVQCDKRIILQVAEQFEFWSLRDAALKLENGIEQVVVIRDAGLTQVEPGTATVLSIVGRESEVDYLTSGLKLL